VIRLDKINLPVFAIGAGVIHAIGLAVLLLLLITLPGPGSDIDPHAVAIDVDIVPASPLLPKVYEDVDQTSALPARIVRSLMDGPRPGEVPERLRIPAFSQPPVSDMGRAVAGRSPRPMTKSWPLGLRAMASSIAAWSSALSSLARSGARRSAASSCPRHI
jgi:hypothetical protein